ncbi:MAG: hypothetical protein WCR51_02025 [Planctomycetia bacterium]
MAISPIGEQGLPAVGRSDSRGVFHLTSTRGGRPLAGAVAGEYVMTVMKTGYDFGGKPPPAEDDTTTEVPVRSFVPDVYTKKDTSPLRIIVKTGGGGVGVYRFEMTSGLKTPPAK